MNKRAINIIIITGSLVILFFVIAIINTKDINEHEHYMFSNIDELTILSPYITEQIENDNFVNDLEPINQYTCKVQFSENNFTVFAYEFKSDLQRVQYIENRMQMTFADSQGFFLTSNMFLKTKYIAYFENKLLYIEGSGLKATYEFLDYLVQDFNIFLG